LGVYRELATLLLDRGADIDAVTAAGPDQPTDIGWTVLGLVATSGRPGQLALLDHLVAAGADLDAPRGGALRGALYYQQRDAARRLVEHGARMDLTAAAGLGRLDVVDVLLAESLDALLGQPRLAHYSQVALPDEPSSEDLLGVALVHAAMGGHLPVIERLIDAGVDVNVRPCFDHAATALHWTVVGDQPEATAWLLQMGADPDLRDTTFESPPRGWAEHLGRERLLGVLPPAVG